MTRCVAILVTMDTKAAEADYARTVIEKMGGRALLIDFGIRSEPTVAPDISAAELAHIVGSDIAELRRSNDRSRASDLVVRGAIATLTRLVEADEVHAVLSMGGTMGTTNGTRVMQSLPYGLPKLMVSTLAAGDMANFVGIRDITMAFSVGDILGLNPLLRAVLGNAAAAAWGMAQAYRPIGDLMERPAIGMTNLGLLTRGTMYAVERLQERGYEPIVFHGVGAGSRAMEQLVREKVFVGLLDYAVGDIADALYGGLRAADVHRLTVAAELGLPQVIVPGGIDHIAITLKEPNLVPDEFRDRAYVFHNPSIICYRPTPTETRRIAEEIAGRIGDRTRNILFMIPTRGVSRLSAPEGPLYDAACDAALLEAFDAVLPRGLEREDVDATAEDPVFVERMIDRLLGMIEAEEGT